MNLSKMLETVKGGLASMSKVTVAKSELQSLKIESKIAHAVTKHTVAYESKSEDGKLHKFVSSGVTHDEYRLVGKDWKMSKMEWVKNDLTVDGKPVKM